MDPELLDRAFDALSAAARLSGVRRVVTRALLRWSRRHPGRRAVTILDVGSGRGDLLRHLDRELGSRGIAVGTIGGDLHPVVPIVARTRPGSPTLLRLQGSRLPLADASVDFVVSTNTLHHLERDRAVRFLAEADRVSRVGWILVDLHRTLLARATVGLLAATVWRGNPLPRHDGPVSVRRAFRAEELRDLVAAAGVGPARVSRWPPLHLTVRGGGLASGSGL